MRCMPAKRPAGMSVMAVAGERGDRAERGWAHDRRWRSASGWRRVAVIAGGFGGAGRMGYSVNGGVVQLVGADPGAVAAIWPGGDCGGGNTAGRCPSAASPFWKWDYIAAGAKRCAGASLYALLGNPVMRASPKFRALIAFHEHIFASLAPPAMGQGARPDRAMPQICPAEPARSFMICTSTQHRVFLRPTRRGTGNGMGHSGRS